MAGAPELPAESQTSGGLSVRSLSSLPNLEPRKRLLFGAATLLVGVTSSLLGGEVFLRLVAPQNLSGTWRSEAPRGYLRNKAGGTARHQLGQRVVFYRFNEHHLRGGTIGAGRRRILALGDSFTFGWLLQEDATSLAHLERCATRRFGPDAFEFLNGGAGGWGTEDYLAFLEDEGDALKPDVVIVFLGIQDVQRSRTGRIYRMSDASPSVLEPTQSSRAPWSLKRAVNAMPLYAFLLEHSHLLQFLRNTTVNWNHEGSCCRPTGTGPLKCRVADARDDCGIAKAKALFVRMAGWCRSHGARLLVTTSWPVAEAPSDGATDASADALFRGESKEFFAATSVEFFDAGPQLERAFDGHAEAFIIPGDHHPNERGARVVAETVWPWLERQLERDLRH